MNDLSTFVSAANKLDQSGRYAEADAVDAMLVNMTRISFHMPWQHDGTPKVKRPSHLDTYELWQRRIEEQKKMEAEMDAENHLLDEKTNELTDYMKDQFGVVDPKWKGNPQSQNIPQV